LNPFSNLWSADPVKKPLAAAFAALVLTSSALTSAAGAADRFSDLDKQEIQKLVKDYILQNPEIIEQAIDALQAKKEADKVAMQQVALKDAAKTLYESPSNVVLGNPKGNVTIVEFFDYNCGYCKRAFPDMMTLLDQDPNLRFILKEFPVLGPGSVEAAQVAAAVHRVAPMKYLDFHKRLITVRGEVNKAKAMEAVTAAGIDAALVTQEMAKPAVNASLQESMTLADGLGISGTPSYVVADAVIPGAIGADRLKERIAAARK
jgi:protein-disulfide isomerase